MKTYVAKPSEIEKQWYVIDASGQTLGKLATLVADTLRGKRKPIYTPNIDTGDFVIVVNADKIALTGSKREQKMDYRHSGYPGGLRATSYTELLEKDPRRAVEKAVKGMLPHTTLGRAQLSKLKVYAGPNHPHQAQKPVPFEISQISQ